MRSVLLLVVLLVGCSESRPLQAPIGPTGPSSVPSSSGWTLSGTVVATQNAAPIRGATIAPFGVTTNDAGTFSASGTGVRAPRLTIEAPGYLTRSTGLSTQAAEPRFDLISLSGFSLDFYRAFVRDSTSGTMRPLRRWTDMPRLYIRRVDEAGQAVDSALISLVERVARETATDWGDRFGFAAIESGTETREGNSAWVTLKWLNPPESGLCGRAQVGTPGGHIELNHLGDNCLVRGGRGVEPGTVRHEIGHAFGFYHTGDDQDLMSGNTWTNPDRRPSPRERYHAALAYTRPPGNTDPDNDPVGHVFSVSGEGVVVVD